MDVSLPRWGSIDRYTELKTTQTFPILKANFSKLHVSVHQLLFLFFSF